MTCCCSNSRKDNKSKTANSGSSYSKRSAGSSKAPGSQRMNDRGDGMDEDTKAVAWLRSRSLENLSDAGDTAPKLEKLPPITIPDDAPIGMPMNGSFENHPEEGNVLEAPYPIADRELPLRPQNGNVLNQGVFRKDSSTSSSKANMQPRAISSQAEIVEVFEAQISPPSTRLPPSLGIPVVGPNGRVVAPSKQERARRNSRSETPQAALEPPEKGTPTRKAEKSANSTKAENREVRCVFLIGLRQL